MSVNKMPTKEINPRLTELARSKQEDLSQLTNLYKKCSSSFETNPNSTTHTSITRSKVSSKIISSPLYNENKEVNKVQEVKLCLIFSQRKLMCLGML